jgi:hypothetical protein
MNVLSKTKPSRTLSLALLVALGACGTAMAQDAALSVKEKVQATAAADAAVDDAHTAHADAESARESAKTADMITRQGALTAQGAATAAATSKIAQQSSLDAQRSSQQASHAAKAALGAKTATDYGNQPVGSLDEAQRAAAAADVASMNAADAAAAAEAAAMATRDAATMPPTPVLPSPAAAGMTDTSQVTVTSSEPDSIVGDYSIDFAAMDTNHNNSISRAEAKSNPTLTAEFAAVDNDHNGRLSKAELKGWIE